MSQLHLETRLHLPRSDEIATTVKKKPMQRNSEKTQQGCHTFYRILGTIPTCLGEAEAAEDLPCSQQVKWTVLYRVTLHTQGSFFPLQLPHLWFIWPEPLSRDWRMQQLLMKLSKIWGWSSSRAVFRAAAMSGWYRLNHIYSCPFQDLLGSIISLNTTYTLA